MTLENIQSNKLKVVETYNKHVKKEDSEEGNLVWKTILPIEIRNPKFDKWSLN